MRSRTPRGASDCPCSWSALDPLTARTCGFFSEPVPASLLDDAERASKWLHDKAFRRVWHARSIRRTTAMVRTPRRVLEASALAGNWEAFPVSPAPYLAELQADVGKGWFDYRATGLVVTLLDVTCERLLSNATTTNEHLAIRRAVLTVCIDVMGRVDDSLDELGQYFREQEHAYIDLIRPYIDRPGILSDLLQVAIWEDYGLFQEIEPFLRSLPEAHADLALKEIASIIKELRAAGLKYHLEKSLALRRALLAVAARYGGE